MWKNLNNLFNNIHEAKKLNVMKKLRVEDNGYELVFRDGKAYLKNINSCHLEKFGVRVKILYTLEEEACTTL